MLVLVGLLAGLVALLAVPLDVAFELERIEATKGHVTIRWLFGLVRVRVAVPRVRAPPLEAAAKRKATRERARREARVGPARVLAVLRQTAFRERVQRLARDLLRAAHPSQLRLVMRLGLGDPADTGLLWALVGPLGAVAQGLRDAEVRIEPEFIDSVLELQARGRALLIPLQILALALSFALSPPSVRAWRTLRSGHA